MGQQPVTRFGVIIVTLFTIQAIFTDSSSILFTYRFSVAASFLVLVWCAVLLLSGVGLLYLLLGTHTLYLLTRFTVMMAWLGVGLRAYCPMLFLLW